MGCRVPGLQQQQAPPGGHGTPPCCGAKVEAVLGQVDVAARHAAGEGRGPGRRRRCVRASETRAPLASMHGGSVDSSLSLGSTHPGLLPPCSLALCDWLHVSMTDTSCLRRRLTGITRVEPRVSTAEQREHRTTRTYMGRVTLPGVAPSGSTVRPRRSLLENHNVSVSLSRRRSRQARYTLNP